MDVNSGGLAGNSQEDPNHHHYHSLKLTLYLANLPSIGIAKLLFLILTNQFSNYRFKKQHRPRFTPIMFYTIPRRHGGVT